MLDIIIKEYKNWLANIKKITNISDTDSAILYKEVLKSKKLDINKLEEINRLKFKIYKKYNVLL